MRLRTALDHRGLRGRGPARCRGVGKVVFDRKIIHVRDDPDAKKELGRKENVEAKADGDPAKDAELIWDVGSSTFDTAPSSATYSSTTRGGRGQSRAG